MRDDSSDGARRAEVGRALAGTLPTDLAAFLPRQRWFASKARRLSAVLLVDWAPLGARLEGPWLALAEVAFREGPPETYTVPLALRREPREDRPPLGRIEAGDVVLAAYDLFDEPEACRELLDGFERGALVATDRGAVRFTRSAASPDAIRRARSGPIRRMTSEQSNTSVVYADALILKAFRRVESGLNPEAEVSEFLTMRTQFRQSPLFVGGMQYSRPGRAEALLATLSQFVSSDGDGWSFTLDHLRRFHEIVRHRPGSDDPDGGRRLVREICADFFRAARRLGELTGGLHVALGSDPIQPAFAPEPISAEDVVRWDRAFSDEVGYALDELQRQWDTLPEALRDRARAVLDGRESLAGRASGLALLEREGCAKTRIHGDYHLGQTLRARDDFVILDFEGEPARPLDERRAKQCPLRDVAGMLRSFDYARAAASLDPAAAEEVGGKRLEPWDAVWLQLTREAFLDGYRAAAAQAPVTLLPPSPEAMARVLEVFELDKALYELRYELNHRPAWVSIPLQGLARFLGRGS